MSLKSFFKKHAMEIQFWAYEGGNVNASIAGSGGYEKFLNDTTTQDLSTLAASYPDATAALLIGSVVVAAPVLRSASQKLGGNTGALNTIDTGTALTSAGILAYTLTNDASWITTSASSFVVGSSLLRFCAENPFFLKAGGLALAFGGVCFSTYGATNLLSPDAALNTKFLLDALATTSGVYVTSASLLTYEGGIYETAAYKDKSQSEGTWSEKLTHPIKGSLSKLFTRYVDAPVQKLNTLAKQTTLRYIPESTRNGKPFLTSMWARLPWRVATGAAALATGDSAFALSNAMWGAGDTAIGSKDWPDDLDKKEEKKLESGPAIL